MRRLLIGLLLLLTLSPVVQALDEFVVADIRVEGLQRIQPGTVFNYLPIKVGDEVDKELTTDAVKVLFKTGFFTDVEIRQQGRVLVVVVKERPSIASIVFKGNKDLRDEALEDALTNSGFNVGHIFNQSVLDRVLQEIRNQYFARGRYSAQVEATVSPRALNRVAIKIEIKEGRVARIKQIAIIGNETYDDEELMDKFRLADTNVFSFLSRKDRFSEEKLRGDTESLRSFYQDHGYLNFKLNSTDVSLSQNKQDIFITISISEGQRFVIRSINVEPVKGITEEEMNGFITSKPGDVFSRRLVAESRSDIAGLLADRGYAFAKVNAITDIDEANSSVSFTFAIDPGPKVYVRRIEITGNSTTRDEVIRRELRQLEGALFSAAKVRRSRVRLQRLGFFEDVGIETESVPGSVDQLDLIVRVKEKPTGSFMVGVGYSDADGALLQASVNRKNLFGSGKELTISFDNSSVSKHYLVEYSNPYHTVNGVSRDFHISSREVDAEEANTAAYLVNTLSLGVGYKIPMSEYNSLNLSLDLENIDLEETDETPPEFSTFITENPSNDNLKFLASIGRDTRDSIFFPSSGYIRRISLEASVPSSDLEYYKVDLKGGWYKSLTRSGKTVMKLLGDVGYGDGYGDSDELPFFKNYFAGGPTSVRGYNSRSLGPQDTGDTPAAIGGSQRLTATAEILFPVPGASESKDKRLGFFIDGGMVFGADQSIDLSELRTSAGISFNWFSPVGPLALSYGIPLNDEDGDDIEKFQLSLGALFR